MPEQLPEQLPEQCEQKNSSSLPTDGISAGENSLPTDNILTEKDTIAAKVIKIVVFAVLGFLAAAGNFFLEAKFVSGEQIKEQTFMTFNYSGDNIIPNNCIIRFDSQTPDPQMDVQLAQTSNPQTSNPQILNSQTPDPQTPDLPTNAQSFKGNSYIFNLKKGRIWGNFSVCNAKINILTGKTVIIPNHADFDLIYDGERTDLDVYGGDVYVGFLPKDIELTEYSDQYSDLFMNRLLVPRDTQISVSQKKVNDKIKPLLYSKLVKEFKHAAIPSSEKESEWVKENIDKDRSYIESLKFDLISEIIHRGASVDAGYLSDFVFWAEENLTFVPGKKAGMILTHLFTFVDDALFYANEGKTYESGISLDNFDVYLFSIPEKIAKRSDYFEKFDDYVNSLNVLCPGDNEYDVFVHLLQRKFSEKRDIYDVVNRFWLKIYDGIDSNDLDAERALNDYYEYFDQTAYDVSDNVFSKRYIEFQNQLFDNLLMRYPVFYKDGYFAIKNAMEKNLFEKYDDGQLKRELKQAFVSNKIDFLKRLRRYFFDGEIDVDGAKQIFLRLFGEINDLMPSDNSQIAVIQLFESQLADMDDFWGYLNSPQYHTKVYGQNHENRYEAYLEERDKIWDFINVHEDVLGYEIEVDIVDVVNEIKAVFDSDLTVSDVTIGDIDDVSQRYVGVNAVIGGYPFEAQYDRSTESLKDIYVYGELISERAVKLSSLLSVLQSKFANLVNDDNQGNEEEITLETTAQRYARIFISEKIAEAGFKADIEKISVVDEDAAIYRVIEAEYKDFGNEALVTFDLNMSGEIAANVLLIVYGDPVALNEQYTLEELGSLITAQHDFPDGIEVGAGSDEAETGAGQRGSDAGSEGSSIDAGSDIGVSDENGEDVFSPIKR